MIKLSGVLLFGFVYSWFNVPVKADSCLIVCRYNDYARDAECTNRGLTSIPTPCTKAHALDISSNYLVSLPPSSFRGYLQLRYLHLENNQITSISPGAFHSVRRRLIQVNISNNYLTEIESNTFVNMTLQYLLLSHNHITRIDPAAFKGMAGLRKLYLGDNRLTSLEYRIFNHMPNLREVNLRNNMIMSLDVSFISNLVSFQKIFIQNNSISELTGHVQVAQTALMLINLSYNQLQSFDCSLTSNLFSLNDLYLNNNSLRTINSCSLQQMSTLKVEDNPFNCDCQLRHLFTWLQENPDTTSPTCSSPESSRGTSVRDAPLESCPEDNASSTTSTFFWIRRHSTTPKKPTTISKTSSYPEETDFDLFTTVDQPGANSQVLQVTKKGDSSKADNSFNRSLLVDKNVILDGPFGISAILFIIIIAIVTLVLIIFILLICCLKCYCFRNSDDEDEKKQYSAVSATCSGFPVEDAKDASIHLTYNHDYELIGDTRPQVQTPCRQYSVDSQGSSTAMLPQQMTRFGESYHSRSSGGLWNPGHHDCICDCHENMSDESGSWAECQGSSCSDVSSYEMDNHINECSESRPYLQKCWEVDEEGRVNCSKTLPDGHMRHSHGRNGHLCHTASSMRTRSPPPTYEGSIRHVSPPPLPPKREGNETYIQHSQLRVQPESNVII